MTWLMNNFATVLICALLAVAVALIIRYILKNKQSGKCFGGCDGCAMKDTCHK